MELFELAALETKWRAGTITPDERERAIALSVELLKRGIVLSSKIAVAPAGPPPCGSVRGRDGIIRTKPGVFEARYRAEALALRVGRSPRAHVPSRMLHERRPAGRPSRGRCRARAPARPEDPELPLDVVPLAVFRRDVDRWLGAP